MAVGAMAVTGEGNEAAKPRLTTKTLFVLGAMNLTDCININLLTPYVDKMVSTFLGKSPQSPEVAHMVSLLIGLYPLCEVLVSPFWGAFADFAGRKPCLLIGLAGSAIAPIIFGLGESLPVIFFARALDGFFCGNMGVTRTYLGEIVDSSNEARAFGLIATCFSFGLVVGPVLGGSLVYPAQWAPGIFGGTIFDRRPFLLPNVSYVILAAIAWVIGAIFLEETVPKSRRCVRRRARQAAQTPDAQSLAEGAANSDGARCFPLATTQTILTYCSLSGCVASFRQLMILVVSYDREADGFDFGPHELGILQNIGAVGLLLCQTFVYPRMSKKLGFLSTYLVGFLCLNLSYALFPVYGMFADPAYGNWRYLPLGLCHFVFTAATGLLFPTVFAFVNRSADSSNRGAINGWTNSGGALCRALFPPVAAVLLAQCNQFGIFGRYIPFYAVSCIMSLSLAFTWPGMRTMDKKGVRPAATAPSSADGDEARSRREPLVDSTPDERK
ncbi:unnamed protein product [Effrenium voratum]|nr:unnamed protein product [Effrenium voratum]